MTISVERAEYIEKRLDELDKELEIVGPDPDREFALRRTKEIMAESKALMDEMMESLSIIDKLFGTKEEREEKKEAKKKSKEEKKSARKAAKKTKKEE